MAIEIYTNLWLIILRSIPGTTSFKLFNHLNLGNVYYCYMYVLNNHYPWNISSKIFRNLKRSIQIVNKWFLGTTYIMRYVATDWNKQYLENISKTNMLCSLESLLQLIGRRWNKNRDIWSGILSLSVLSESSLKIIFKF